MPRLGVNVDHIATLRQARYKEISSLHIEPDPVKAALSCLEAGADSIVMHLREDRRHIQDKDISRFIKSVGSERFNLEMSTIDEIVAFALRILPGEATLVPEKRQELTTEGGLDVIKFFDKINKIVCKLKAKKIRVSLFINPDQKQIIASKESGAESIELHTGEYSEAKTYLEQTRCLEVLRRAAILARDLGLEVHAGHGLNYNNIQPVAKIKDIKEFNIGHSIISRAVFIGLNQAVEEMRNLIQ